jgi:hypothetical protein
MEPAQVWTSVGLSLDVIGVVVIMWSSASRYLRSWFRPDVKKEMEDEAIGVAFNRLAPDKRDDMLQNPYVRGFIATHRSSFLGFLLLVLGFVGQLVGANL